ncbi:serine hydrolase domain-containing protein [Armatimonas sp.]|uniref:serine hydrolase domain-containing protein n=1 Tax=Armatimonas sp. TaxID=1872638 RepID=UPI003752685C
MKTNLSRRSLLVGAGTSALVRADSEAEARGSQKLPRDRGGAINTFQVEAFVKAAEEKKLGIHSLMLVKHGKVCAEGWWGPYGPEHPHMLYSLSKSFTSTAVGLAVAEGKLSLSDKVLSFFEKERPAKPDSNLAAMEVRHLLMMGTGHDKDTTGAVLGSPNGDWVKTFLSLPVEHAPGSKFVYNTGATYLLSAIVQAVTRKTVLAYLKPRLFEPLGIQNPTWETCPKGRSTGGFGLSITTEDIAKLGVLLVQKGKWNDKQLLPESWVTAATSKHISNGDPSQPSDWTQGYGYQFWRCRNGIYRGDGAFGQFCIVLPEHQGVIVLTAGSGDLQGIMNAIHEHLVPAFGRPGSTHWFSGPGEPRNLNDRTIATPTGVPTSPMANAVYGKTYHFAENPQKIQWLKVSDKKVVVKTAAAEWKLPYSTMGWARGTAEFPGYLSKKVATHGAWIANDTLALTVVAYETPYIHTLTCQFVGENITLARKTNVGFGPTESPALTGKAS